MFIGHYGVSFAAKRADTSVPLWVLFIAVQLLMSFGRRSSCSGDRESLVSCRGSRHRIHSTCTTCRSHTAWWQRLYGPSRRSWPTGSGPRRELLLSSCPSRFRTGFWDLRRPPMARSAFVRQHGQSWTRTVEPRTPCIRAQASMLFGGMWLYLGRRPAASPRGRRVRCRDARDPGLCLLRGTTRIRITPPRGLLWRSHVSFTVIIWVLEGPPQISRAGAKAS